MSKDGMQAVPSTTNAWTDCLAQWLPHARGAQISSPKATLNGSRIHCAEYSRIRDSTQALSVTKKASPARLRHPRRCRSSDTRPQLMTLRSISASGLQHTKPMHPQAAIRDSTAPLEQFGEGDMYASWLSFYASVALRREWRFLRFLLSLVCRRHLWVGVAVNLLSKLLRRNEQSLHAYTG